MEHNYFGTNYIGPNNPKDYNGKWDYTLAPKNKVDAGAEQHDKSYDHANVSGLSGLLFSLKTIKADQTLIIHSFGVAIGSNSSLSERVEGVVVGLSIAAASYTKTAASFQASNPYVPLR